LYLCFCVMQWRAIGQLCDISFNTLFSLFVRWTQLGLWRRLLDRLHRPWRIWPAVMQRSRRLSSSIAAPAGWPRAASVVASMAARRLTASKFTWASLVTRVEEAKAEFEDYKEQRTDHMQDEWKEC
jgi:hypothetical protein